MTSVATTEDVHGDRAGFRLDEEAGPVPLTSAPTIGAALLELAERDPDRPVIYVEEKAGEPIRLTAAELAERAAAAATALAEHGVKPGDRVGICLDTSVDAHTAIHGCFLLGAVPFVSEPPLATMRRQRWAGRLRLLFDRAGAKVLVASPAFRDAVAEPCAEAGVTIVEPPFEGGYLPGSVRASADDIALLQFTSGTTGNSRGVVLTHDAIMANVRAIGERAFREGDLFVSWLPLHHDMGMIGLNLAPLLHGLPVVSMPPLSFALRPERWLWTMHRYRGTFTSAPNFAYQLCVTKVPDEKLAGLDLSSWRVAGNGAEVVNAATLRAFTDRMRPYGYRDRAMMPCYGMAEVVLAASMNMPGNPLTTLTIRRDVLAATGEAVPAGPDDPDRQELVSSGPPMSGTEIRVVDAEGVEVPDRTQGDILVSSPSLMSGYYRQPEETAKVLKDGWLHTGDQGFRDGEHLYVTGRVKDVVIIAGRNYHPYVFEGAAANAEGVQPGAVAAVGCPDAELGTEALTIVAESRVHADQHQAELLAKSIVDLVTAETGLRPDRVEIVPRGTLPKTPSGKLQRPQIVQSLLDGTLVRRS
ncbi:MAG TPA: fatty acyl-AMP ligase [Streptomyces sp.]|uniref:fatty acyl-AMP ligase n=1 Tax=Streptomyces sp. TaxID=1931 RepID=UPI002D6A11FC|nr:fatty acyl-AMP ligase [Streptomyces sp.]HZG02678.1 fatty acyl-AMP ligase [Streptomyces sp.]